MRVYRLRYIFPTYVYICIFKSIEAGVVENITVSDLKDGLALTATQMESMLRYFKENDMNGNGDAQDERPMNFVYNNWQGNQCDLYGMFGLNDFCTIIPFSSFSSS